jgi:hypothetical protein
VQMAYRTVTIFPTLSADGVEFGEGAREIASVCGYQVRVVPSATLVDVVRETWGEGVVVFDATIDAPDQHNYHAATYSLLTSLYSVVVSRSYLLMNFRGHLEPIAPPYPERWSNAELLPRLRQRLLELAPRFPKPAGARSLKGMLDLIESGQALVQQKRKDSFDVFLSYRGTHAQAAQRLVDESLREYGSSARTTCPIPTKCYRCNAGGRFFAASLLPCRPRTSSGSYGRVNKGVTSFVN